MLNTENTNFMGDRIKSDAKYRRERNPLFSLAPPRFYAPAQKFRKRSTRESVNLCAYDRWITEACANIAHASYGRPEMQRASMIASRASASYPAYMRFVWA